MLRFNLEKLPAWVPDIGTIVEICRIGFDYLPGLQIKSYRAKVISVSEIRNGHLIQLEGYDEKILLYRGIDEAQIYRFWLPNVPVHLSF